MYNTSFFKKILLVAIVIFLYSCDKEYNAIGDNLIGDNHFNLENYESNVIAYNQKVTPVQSNNLASNPLGIYDNPAFGTTIANFVTQVVMESYAPSIGESPVVENVVLSVPYYSRVTKVNSDGTSEYQLDSIYGPSNGKIKLSIYESGYFIRNLDPNGGSQTSQLYYSNQDADFDAVKKGLPLNDNKLDKSQNEEFFFNPAEIVDITTKTDTEAEKRVYSKPEMHLTLNNEFFQNKILNASADKLASESAFKEYFRGLYFKVEKSGTNPSSLANIDFSKGKITIKYKIKTASTTDDEQATEQKTLVIKLGGNTVSLLTETNVNSDYSAAIAQANTTLGDNQLYLKGGEGSMSVIELFDKTDVIGFDDNGNLVNKPNGVSDELDRLRNPEGGKQLLINEANLVFYINSNSIKDSFEPNRIYLYDFTNNLPVVDYEDQTTTSDSKNNRYVFDGIIKKDATSKKGISYKIRITNHIRNLIKYKTLTNVKLGIVVTENINNSVLNKLRMPEGAFTKVPQASVMNPLGTILHGGTSSVPEEKRLKLQIYYTKPN